MGARDLSTLKMPPGARASRLPLRPLTRREQLRAAVVLAAGATGPDDLRELLDAAGFDLDELRALRADVDEAAGTGP